MLSARHITCTIGGKTILDNVSAEFRSDLINLIIGPNGAGKSTFIRIISNQLKPDKGEVFYDGLNLKDISSLELARMRAVLSQNTELAFPLKVNEVVMMGRYPHFTGKPRLADESVCEEAMRYFGVYEFSERNYLTLSGGEKQRVQFARVLAQVWNPLPGRSRYLILDEPLTFLDVHYQFDFMNKLVALLGAGNLTVVGVVHDLNLAARFAGHLVLLSNGKVLDSGDRYHVLSKENILKAYHIESTVRKEGERIFLVFD